MTQQPIVTVQQGQLRGKTARDYCEGQYYSFQGIPYAKPPLGELRFKAPQLPEPWSGIREATAEGSTCYHRQMFRGYAGSEDCLFLNVYTPELLTNGSACKPVMVWIHGGGFLYGSGNTDLYGPDFLIAQDVVVVTINYRFGLLGFLSLEDSDLGIPGNAGLKDQVFALKWVQGNISQFSGDPNNVTIFGQSSGAASVHYLIMSSMAKGLFHKAIIQSGTVFDSWSRGQRSAPLIAKALNLDITDEKVILKILQDMSVEDLFKIQEKLSDAYIQYDIRAVGVVVETPNDTAFLSEEPADLINSSRFNKVPILIGYTSREGIFAEIHSKFKFGKVKLVRDFETVIPYMLKFRKGSDMSKTLAQKIKHFYYGEEEPSMENIEQYYLLETDSFFSCTIHNTIKHHTMTSSTPIYFYKISIDSTLNIYKHIGKVRHSGACHGDDIGYLFKTMLTPKIRPGSIEDEGIKRCTKLWTTFARNGNPNPVEKDPLINVMWKPVQDGVLNYLNIGENLTIGINPDAGRMEFWSNIFSLSSTTSKL